MNKDRIDFNNAIAFICKLRCMEERNIINGNHWPIGIKYRDEFENLEKFVRRGYYGNK